MPADESAQERVPLRVNPRLSVSSLTVAVAAVAAVSIVGTATATRRGTNGRIAFTRYVNALRTEGSIFTIDPSGTNERRVTRAPRGSVDYQPDWSPDGSLIVFQRQYQDKPYEVFTVRPDGSGLAKVDPGCPRQAPRGPICEENDPAWSPDGRRLAFFWAYGGEKTIRGEKWIDVGAIAVMDRRGRHVRQLTQLRRPTRSEDIEPVWSPDGRRIAFVRLNSSARPHDRRAIFVMNADGSGVRRLTPWQMDAGDHPDWSPNGKRILFRAPDEPLTGSSLYTIRPDGRALRRVTRFGATVDVLSASFSPDGQWIVFSRTGRGGLPDVFVIRPDGTGMRQVTRTLRWDSAADWGPR